MTFSSLNLSPWIFQFFSKQKKDIHLRILGIGLLVATMLITFVCVFTDAIRINIEQKSSELMGADLVIEGIKPFDEALLNYVSNQNSRLSHTQVLSFLTMLENGAQLRLVLARAIEETYPLRGKVILKADKEKVLTPGTLWVDEAILSDLNAKLEDNLTLGAASFKIQGIIESAPDRGADFSAMAPNVFLSIQDLEKTQILQPGSKVTYKLLVKYDESRGGTPKDIELLQSWLTEKSFSDIEFYTAKTGRLNLRNSLDKVQDYILLGTLLNVLLAGIAIAIASLEFIKSRYQDMAILRSMGASLKEIVSVFCIGFLKLAGKVIPVGVVIGGLLAYVTVNAMGHFVQITYGPLVSGIALGFGMLFLFALPPIYFVRHVSTLSLIQEKPVSPDTTQVVMLGCGIIGFSGVLWAFLGQAVLILATLTFLVMYGLLVALIYRATLKGLSFNLNLIQRRRGRANLSLKQGILSATRNFSAHFLPTVSFSLAIGIFLVMQLLAGDLWRNWQETLPSDSPNFFGINLSAEQIETLGRYFQEHQIVHSPFYPIVSGKLVQLNQQKGDLYYRPLNLSETAKLPTLNKVVSGEWPTQVADIDSKPAHSLSVEAGFANRLNLKMGDRLSFNVGGKMISGEITQLRSVKWDSFLPNFFVLFPPNVFSPKESRYMVSFYMADEQRVLLKILTQQYPSMTLFDLKQILKEARNILLVLQTNLNRMLLVTLAFSILILFSILQATMAKRQYEVALLKAIGAYQSQIRKRFVVEFGIIGFIAGLSGAIFAHGLAYALSEYVFDMRFVFDGKAFFLAPFVGMLLLVLFSVFFLRKTLSSSTALVLSQE